MNSIEVTNSPPIKDENYVKTASLLKVIEAPQTPTAASGDEKHGLLSDINDNNEVALNCTAHCQPSGRGAYIPYHTGFEVKLKSVSIK